MYVFMYNTRALFYSDSKITFNTQATRVSTLKAKVHIIIQSFPQSAPRKHLYLTTKRE